MLKSVIYNSAPLYIENGVDLYMDANETNRALYLRRLRRYKKNKIEIQKKISDFTGQIIHFSSEDDVLNRLMSLLQDEAVYCCSNYVLKNAGKHPIKKAMLANSAKLIQDILDGKEYKASDLAKDYAPLTKLEAKNMLKVANSGELSLEYFC